MQAKALCKMSNSRFKKPKLQRLLTEGCDSAVGSFRLKTHGFDESKQFLSKMMRCGTQSAPNKENTSQLQQILKEGHKTRKRYLRRVMPTQPSTIRSSLDCKKTTQILSTRQRSNIKAVLRRSLDCQMRNNSYVSEISERQMTLSFNKVVKAIKTKGNLISDGNSSQLKSRVEVFTATLKGSKHTVNQDSLVWAEGVYIIADGHGTHGKPVSHFITTTALRFFQEAYTEHPKFDIQAHHIIHNVVKKLEIELQMSGIDIAYSGCTFICLIMHNNQLYTVNIGDSKAIITQGLAARPLSIPHKPDTCSESKRIEQCGGVIRPMQLGKDRFVGPNRIWAPGKNSWGPGLALSRAFGDTSAHKFGVISEAEVKTHQITFEDDFIVMGSDGLFDYMKDSEIAFFVRSKLREEDLNRDQIAMSLAEQARINAGPDCDDISCIVILL